CPSNSSLLCLYTHDASGFVPSTNFFHNRSLARSHLPFILMRPSSPCTTSLFVFLRIPIILFQNFTIFSSPSLQPPVAHTSEPYSITGRPITSHTFSASFVPIPNVLRN